MIYIIIGGKMKQILLILLISILVDNFCMSKFLGICPFLGVSRKVETAIGMGMAVTFVMVLASIITWLVQLLLVALNIKFAQTIAFILVIAALVQVQLFINHLVYICHLSRQTVQCLVLQYLIYKMSIIL